MHMALLARQLCLPSPGRQKPNAASVPKCVQFAVRLSGNFACCHNVWLEPAKLKLRVQSSTYNYVQLITLIWMRLKDTREPQSKLSFFLYEFWKSRCAICGRPFQAIWSGSAGGGRKLGGSIKKWGNTMWWRWDEHELASKLSEQQFSEHKWKKNVVNCSQPWFLS